METSRRDARFDNLKGILIFLVVFGHLLELVGGPAAAWLYRLIYSFHMPAFVFCSGWFARFDAARFFRRLLYPYLVYQTLYLLFDRLVLHGGINAVLWPDKEAIVEEIRRVVPVLKENGGYIFSSDHSIPNNVPLENFRAIVEEVKQAGRYN